MEPARSCRRRPSIASGAAPACQSVPDGSDRRSSGRVAAFAERREEVMDIKSLHHVAYRCIDARQTVDFYTRILGLEYAMAVAEERVPSTGEESPYMHVFFRMDDGSYVAFFEVPGAPPMGRDEATPRWVRHLALRVADEATLLACKARLESHGVEVLGPTDHGFCKS